jgi:hypothetical protein
MNTNLNSPIAFARSISGEGWAAIAGAIGSAFLLAKKLLSPKPAHKPELVTRADFYAEMLATRERRERSADTGLLRLRTAALRNRSLSARGTLPAVPVTRAVSPNKQAKKESK